MEVAVSSATANLCGVSDSHYSHILCCTLRICALASMAEKYLAAPLNFHV